MGRMTFGEELLQFAKTVDILDEKLFFKIKKIINNYAKERWEIEYVKIMKLRFDRDGNRILEKFFLKEYTGVGNTGDFFNVDTNKGQMAFVINQREPVWITCQDRNNYLDECSNYIDSWSGLDNIPEYQSIALNQKIKTSIIVPFYELEKEKKYLRGVANYEIPKFIPFNDECKQEILYLTDTISELLNLYTVRERQETNTSFAIKKLQYKLDNLDNIRRENKIFIASPYLGKKDVKNAIFEVLEEKFPNIGVENWEDNKETGSVTENLFTKIDSCMYGICYFSQENDNGKGYVDNINVAFEAGLMHSKFRTYKDDKPLWIPIREEDSPAFPFDVKDFNTIVVPRDEDGVLFSSEFKINLTNFLLEMMKKIENDILLNSYLEEESKGSFIDWIFNRV